MTRQRAVLYGIGAVVAALVAVVAIVVTSGGGGGPNQPLPSASAYVPLEASSSTTSTAARPAAPTQAPTATPPTAPPLPAVDKPVTASGSALTPPPVPDVRTEDSPNDCRSLTDHGWRPLDCQTAQTPLGSLTYLIEVAPSPSYVSTRAYVFRRTATGAEEVVLEAIDDAGNRYDTSELEAAIAPIGAFGAQEIVIGFPLINGSLTGVEVVQWPGVVALHEELNGGVVESATGQLDTWARTPDGSYVHDRIEQGGTGWHIVGEETVAEAEVPRVSILA